MPLPWYQRPLFRAVFFVLFGIFLLFKSDGDPVVIAGGIFIAVAGIGLNYYAWLHSQKTPEQN